jgi:hypothetical protein
MPPSKPRETYDTLQPMVVVQSARLETITQLVTAMIRSYDGSASLHSVMPFVSLMRIWLTQQDEETPVEEEEEE